MTALVLVDSNKKKTPSTNYCHLVYISDINNGVHVLHYHLSHRTKKKQIYTSYETQLPQTAKYA
jgi:hypothetical protein